MGFRRILQGLGAGRAACVVVLVAAALALSAGSAAAAITPPTASFGFAPAKPLVGDSVTFASAATTGSAPIFLQAWDFDDDGHWDSFGTTAAHTFSAPGTYTVSLTVLALDGRLDVETHTVQVFRPPTASFGFSPAKPGAGRPMTLTSTSAAELGPRWRRPVRRRHRRERDQDLRHARHVHGRAAGGGQQRLR
jgi:plastocyanin